jgi:hypothetical protein
VWSLGITPKSLHKPVPKSATHGKKTKKKHVANDDPNNHIHADLIILCLSLVNHITVGSRCQPTPTQTFLCTSCRPIATEVRFVSDDVTHIAFSAGGIIGWDVCV